MDDHWFRPIAEFFRDQIAGPLLFGVTGAVLASFASAYRRRRNFLVRSLPFERSRFSLSPRHAHRGKISIAYGLIPPHATQLPYYMVEEGDLSALYTLATLLGTIYGRSNLEFDNHTNMMSDLHYREELVTMSGPLFNRVTELYLGLAGSPVTWELFNGDMRLRVQQPGSVSHLETQYMDGHRPKRCYGIVLGATVRNGGRDQHIVLLGGSSNLSTYGSALFLNSMYSDREIQSELRQHRLWREKRWLVVVRVENWGEPLATRRTSIPPMNVGVLKLSIERVFVDAEFSEPYEYHLEREISPKADQVPNYWNR